MTGSERPSPEPLLKKEASPAVLGENSGNALMPQMPSIIGLGDPSLTLEGILGNALRAFPVSFRIFSESLAESPSRTGGIAISGKRRAHTLKKNPWDTGRVSLGHPAGQTDLPAGVPRIYCYLL